VIEKRRETESAVVSTEHLDALRQPAGDVLREALGAGWADAAEWRHYPAQEVYDPLTHVQYFFHRHPTPGPEPRSAEYGHFHLFLRGEAIPADAAPLLFAETAVANAPVPPQSAPLKRGNRDELCHLIAIAVTKDGAPVRLFTTNRWVTGETWYRADDVICMLDRVRFAAPGPVLLNRWIVALVRLFRPEIAVLLRQRDKTIVDWRWRWPRSNALEDARLETTSSFSIDLPARLIAAQAGHRRAPAMPPATQRRPSMAEGWGS